ncbi:MAG: hypothetical protein EXS03_05370 [Phycisphaerales bacterium]|nr:hypothetical protein [Phycisphaerales bacterium]
MTTPSIRTLAVATIAAFGLAGALHATAQAPAAPAVAPPPAAATTPTDPLPSANEIFAKAIAASGGADLIRQQTSRTQTGIIEMPAQKLKGTIVTKSLSPDFIFVETEIPGFGKIIQGVNKDIGWSIDPMRGPSLMTAEELAQVVRDASVESELNPSFGFDSVTVVEKTKFKGTPCYKVRFAKGKGGSTKYYAVDTGLLAGSEDSVESAMGTMDVVTVYKEFATFSGRTVAKVQEAVAMGQVQRVTIDTLDFSPLTPDSFALPAEIQALVTTAKTPATATPAPATTSSPTPASPGTQ